MDKKLVMFWGIVCIGFALFFQNCGKAGFDTAIDPEQFSSLSAAESDAPFAFNLKFDRLGYMSCSGPDMLSSEAFFTFKGGSYLGSTAVAPNGGLSLNKSFISYVLKNVRPATEAGEVTAVQVKDLLDGSPLNFGARPQFSVRGRSNVQGTYSADNGNAVMGQDISFFLGDLSHDDAYMSRIIQNEHFFKDSTKRLAPSPVNYFPLAGAGSNFNRNIEASILVNSDAVTADCIRKITSGLGAFDRPVGGACGLGTYHGDLAITYSNSNMSPLTAVRSNSADPQLAFGTRFELAFEALSNAPTPYANALSTVAEYDLNTSRNSAPRQANWTCTKYMVVSYLDNLGPNPPCPHFDVANTTNAVPWASIPITPAQRKMLDEAYSLLKPEYWEVNPVRRCVVSRIPEHDCYAQERKAFTNSPTAVGYYDFSAAGANPRSCYSMAVGGNVTLQQHAGGTADGAILMCPEFATICSRTP